MDGNINRQTSLLLSHEEIMLVKKLPLSMESEVLINQ
jgi:hypothetical protein